MKVLSYTLCAIVFLAAVGCDEAPKERTTKSERLSERTGQKPKAEKTEKDIAEEFGAIVQRFQKLDSTSSYDVERTNSLTSPYTGVLTWHEPYFTYRAHFAYQEGRWVFTTKERKEEGHDSWKETALGMGVDYLTSEYYESPSSK